MAASRSEFGVLTRDPDATPPYDDPPGENCLVGIRCPECKGARGVWLGKHLWQDDGCETDNTDLPVNRPIGQPATCADCGYKAPLANFREAVVEVQVFQWVQRAAAVTVHARPGDDIDELARREVPKLKDEDWSTPEAGELDFDYDDPFAEDDDDAGPDDE
jgi:hypothetical protein